MFNYNYPLCRKNLVMGFGDMCNYVVNTFITSFEYTQINYYLQNPL